MSQRRLDRMEALLAELDRANAAERSRNRQMERIIAWLRMMPSLEGLDATEDTTAASRAAAPARTSGDVGAPHRLALEEGDGGAARAIEDVGAAPDGGATEEQAAKRPCRYWTFGHCVWGDSCALSHETFRPEGSSSTAARGGHEGGHEEPHGERQGEHKGGQEERQGEHDKLADEERQGEHEGAQEERQGEHDKKNDKEDSTE